MKKITMKQVDKILALLGEQTESITKFLLNRFAEEQPALFDYICKADSRFDRNEADLLITTATMGWHIVREKLGRCSKVCESFIEERYIANLRLFDEKIVRIAKGKEKWPLTIISMFNEQTELMAFLGSLIFDRREGFGGPVRNKNTFPMLMHLKTLVDCLVLSYGEGTERPAERNEKYGREERASARKKTPGRNERCPCGSGKKYKKCCGAA
jgi:hypothetical protein